jgi:hypothetical protein
VAEHQSRGLRIACDLPDHIRSRVQRALHADTDGHMQDEQVGAAGELGKAGISAGLIGPEHDRTNMPKRIILKQETVTHSRCFPRGRPLQEEWKPVMDDFTTQNSRPRTLPAGFDIGVDYLLVANSEIDGMFDQRVDWRPFYTRYLDSGGFMDVSAVGFDPTKARAMVYVAHRCGGLCGRGTYHFMEKTDGQWREATIKDLENCVWVS